MTHATGQLLTQPKCGAGSRVAIVEQIQATCVFVGLADRVGRQPVLVGSTTFFSLCMLGTAAAESVQQLVILRFLTGLGIGGVMANAVALASEYSPQRQRASLLMWISCGFTGGAIAGGLISAALIPWGGWRSVFLVGGVLPLALTIAIYALEILVAFLQAYVFAILTVIYLNDALHPGH